MRWQMRHGLYLNSRSPRGGAVGGEVMEFFWECGALLENVVTGNGFLGFIAFSSLSLLPVSVVEVQSLGFLPPQRLPATRTSSSLKPFTPTHFLL